MKENTARKLFQNEETFKQVKEGLDVAFLNPAVMLAVSEKAIASITYWEERKVKNQTPEYKQICDIEIAKLEALMQRMTDLSLDVYEVNASAYLDTRGNTPDKTVEDVLVDIAQKANPIIDKPAEESEKESPVLSIFNGEEEVKTPKLQDLAIAIKHLLKKGHFDSANLMAGKYLMVGNYIPKKEKQKPEKWTEEKIASWIRDLNDHLMSEKQGSKKEPNKQEPSSKEVISDNPEFTTPFEKKENADAARNGLTLTEVENLRLLNLIIPETITNSANYEDRREVLDKYLHLGKDLNAEEAMLWAFAKRIGGDIITAKLPENQLSKLYVDLSAFSKIFFAHRPYTEESIKNWFDAARKEIGLANFKFLVDKGNTLFPKMQKAGINMEMLDKRIAEEVAAGKTVDVVVADLEPGILYKVIEGKDKNNYHVYSKLHAKDLIERIYSVHFTKPKKVENKSKEAPTTIISTGKTKVDINEVKILLKTLAENGAIFDPDIKGHPEILNLINREIQDNSKSPALKFGNEAVLLPYIERLFNEIARTVPKPEPIETIIPEEAETPYVDLANILTLCEFAAKNDVSEEDFIKEHIDLVTRKDGSYKSFRSENSEGGSRTINMAGKKDFETWVSSVYKRIGEEKTNGDLKLVNSMKELIIEGNSLIKKGTSYDQFVEWVNKNLLNRKMVEQKADKIFKSSDAIKSFIKNTFKTIQPSAEITSVGEPKENLELTIDEIHKIIEERSKDGKTNFLELIKLLKEMYVVNKILLDGKECTLKNADTIVLSIVKETNPEMYKLRTIQKAENEAKKNEEQTVKAETIVENKEVEPSAIEEPETIEAEHQVFEKVDIAAVDPELWNKTISKFTTMDEVYNMALEYLEAKKFNEALSMALVIMPNLAESKDWTPEQITDWFNSIVLKQTPANQDKSEVVETSAEKSEIELGEEFNDIKNAKNPKSFKRAIAEILKNKADSKELRDQIIIAINTGNGSHTRQVSKMPDTEKHKQINNIKEKLGKFEKSEQA